MSYAKPVVTIELAEYRALQDEATNKNWERAMRVMIATLMNMDIPHPNAAHPTAFLDPRKVLSSDVAWKLKDIGIDIGFKGSRSLLVHPDNIQIQFKPDMFPK